MKPARAISGLVLICTSATLAQPILYVDADATGPTHDGSTWCSAFPYLQDALDAARASNGAVTEIRVADGVYRPDQRTQGTPGDRFSSFRLVDGVMMLGGYAGCGAEDADDRNPATFGSLLSGDLLGDDRAGFSNRSDNSSMVAAADGNLFIDGFSISGGHVDQPLFWDFGAVGLRFTGEHAIIRNVEFRDNWSSASFGALSCLNAGTIQLELEHCRFVNNSGGETGGLYISWDAVTYIHECEFVGNHGGIDGGAVLAIGGQTTISSSIFRGNDAAFGGAIAAVSPPGTLSVRDSIFIANRASHGGAYFGVYSATFSNCTFVANVASRLGAVATLGCSMGLDLLGCVLWQNADVNGSGEFSQIETWPGCQPATLLIDHSLIQGWTGLLGGVGNIGGDPMFFDPLGPDSVAGTADDDLRLQRGSPCVDAGDNAAVPADAFDLDGDGDTAEPTPLDFAGRPRFVNDPLALDTGLGERPIVDMGALERQVVLLDIDPGRCPNRLPRRSHGLVQAAVVGTDAFDVSAIDLNSLRLARADGVGSSIRPDPRHGSHDRPFRDVTSPFDGDLCDCTRARRDGIDDLVLRFRANDIADLLDDESKHGRDSTTLTLTGSLRDGTAFDASDCVSIARGDHRKP